MLTSEGRLKKYVSKRWRELGAHYHMPVPSGYGRQHLDYLVCLNGKFIGCETKGLGKEPTARQYQCIEEIKKAGGIAFWCDSPGTFEEQLLRYGLTEIPAPSTKPAIVE